MAGELSLMGYGRPTTLLGLQFTNPEQQVIWDHAIIASTWKYLDEEAKKKTPEGEAEEKAKRMIELKKKGG